MNGYTEIVIYVLPQLLVPIEMLHFYTSFCSWIFTIIVGWWNIETCWWNTWSRIWSMSLRHRNVIKTFQLTSDESWHHVISREEERDSRFGLRMLEHMERKRAVVYHDRKVLQEVGHCTKQIVRTEHRTNFRISSYKSYLSITTVLQILQIFQGKSSRKKRNNFNTSTIFSLHLIFNHRSSFWMP